MKNSLHMFYWVSKMTGKFIFKTVYNDKKENSQTQKNFERLLIQNILKELKEKNFINAEEFSAAIELLLNSRDS